MGRVMAEDKPKRQFWATKAFTPARELEIAIARAAGLELFELKSQAEAFCVAQPKGS
jgi:hypothetical protein